MCFVAIAFLGHAFIICDIITQVDTVHLCKNSVVRGKKSQNCHPDGRFQMPHLTTLLLKEKDVPLI